MFREKSNLGESLLPVQISKVRQRQTSLDELVDKSDENGPRFKDIESADFDYYESNIHEASIHQLDHTFFTGRTAKRWMLTMVIGILTACVGAGITCMVRVLSEWKFEYIQDLIVPGDNSISGLLIPYLSYLGISVGFVLFASSLVCFIEPVAIGSGISEIKTLLNGVRLPRVVRIKTLICKAVGVLFSVAGGLPVGKEGPMIHSGAIIAAGMSQGKSTALGFDVSCLKLKEFRNDKEKRDFIVCGAAAGVAAAFGSPVGGVMFALEEGASFWYQSLTWQALFCAMVSTQTLNIILSATEGKWGKLSTPGMFTFGDFDSVNQHQSYSIYELFFFILVGVGGGLFGALYNHWNMLLTKFRGKYLNKPWKKWAEAALIAASVATLSFAVPYFFGRCLPMVEQKSTDGESEQHFQRFFCDVGEYDELASIFWTPGEHAIKNIFHLPRVPGFSLVALALFFVPFYLLSCWTYGVAVPSGLFVPSLLAGSAYGRIIGQVLNHFLPGAVVDPGTYALIGAASVLGGMARMTISLAVILLESTGDYRFGLPLVITLMVARLTGNLFNEGLYDIHIHLKKWPILEWQPESVAHFLLSSDVMAKEVVTVEPVERVGHLLQLISETPHNCFPVTPKSDAPKKHFKGIILRKVILVILKKKHGFKRAKMAPGSIHLSDCLTGQDLEKMYPRYYQVDELDLSHEDLESYVDLTHYINPTPYTIQQAAPLVRVFDMFRTLGLRHVPVVDTDNCVVGMITRKDLIDHSVNNKVKLLISKTRSKRPECRTPKLRHKSFIERRRNSDSSSIPIPLPSMASQSDKNGPSFESSDLLSASLDRKGENSIFLSSTPTNQSPMMTIRKKKSLVIKRRQSRDDQTSSNGGVDSGYVPPTLPRGSTSVHSINLTKQD
eukprot:TRINITY_DN28836_c0_g1_i1.p1 TRINITY_DN28836_c0_g1~~TRINITY_DN28836_c0_g1_i1.p1  ORF type:complete len:895 (+),score=278.33 TRINITY_DN28836_c0_g1_i1:62-2746(+)